MKVFLNELELEQLESLPETVGEILDQLRDEISKNGKVITSIAVDKDVLKTNSSREKAWLRHSSEVERVDLTVEEPRYLLTSGLTDTRDFLQSLRNDLVSTATAFRLGDEATANNELARCLDDLQLVLTGMSAASRLPGVEAETKSLRENLLSSNPRLLPLLDSMYKAQASGDYVTLADGLEYDLTEIADEWISVLNHTLRSMATEKDTALQEA